MNMARRVVAMSFAYRPRAYGVVVLAACTAMSLLGKPITDVSADQSPQEADGARLLKGAIDMHFHMDPPGPNSAPGNEQADIAKVRIAHARGLRALVIKDHNQPTAGLVYHLRLAGAGDWVAAMHQRGFADPELDVMFKENPARLLGLPAR
jgi:hypothetical protein